MKVIKKEEILIKSYSTKIKIKILITLEIKTITIDY